MPIYTRAGGFDRRIVIQLRADTVDELGQSVPTWSDLATDVPAACEPSRGREYYAGLGVVAESPMLFRTWYRADVVPTMRVNYGGVIYTIDYVEDFHDARRETHIYARAGVNQG